MTDANETLRAVLYLRVSTKEQAEKGGEAEGYSIPAQRDACNRKAASLGAAICAEFTDPGESGTTMRRPGLQKLLEHIAANRVDFVIFHKIDRLARQTADYLAINVQAKAAGATLVSCTENIDETPEGELMGTMLSGMATFYSKNLGREVKKGIQQKVLMGGTPGYCRLGYLNTLQNIEGREVKCITPDPDRAPHIQWMFETFASGQCSITDIVRELDRRGLRTRQTATRIGKPLTRSQVHRILTNPYYIGKLPFKGVVYDGRHEALIDEQTFQRVQRVLVGRRTAGDRSWRHEHHLKGTLFCDRCGSRLGYGISRGKTGRYYAYFFCLGRHTRRKECDLPHIPADRAEDFVLDHWQKRKLAPEVVARTRDSVRADAAALTSTNRRLVATQTNRIDRLEERRQRLIDAHLDGAIRLEDLKHRQATIDADIAEARKTLSITQVNTALFHERLELALYLLENCHRLYSENDGKTRRDINQALYAEIRLDSHGVASAILNSPFVELLDYTIGLQASGPDGPDQPGDYPDSPSRPLTGTKTSRTPRPTTVRAMAITKKNPEISRSRGSNFVLMAEKEGFEPSRQVITHLTP
jgi:site-specific DNA recombinase